ncbi:MAG: type IV secretion system DNA-binding domain-containing protein [bacterium]|nr:type IV secretion system DNA-binding domain-containing protein [bacterium]
MALPDENRITYFAFTDARNKRVPFGIKAKDRTRHTYVIGKTGMGKSTLLENMAIQDIQNGEGLAFIDPHGKTAEYLLDFVPEHRIKDVLYFAPFDMEHPIAFNVMEDVGPDKRHLVVSGLMSAFKKIWEDMWSARMEYILQNTILALLEYPGATMMGINKMFSDKEYRKKVVDNVTDPTVKSFWVDEFAKYTERFAAEATPAIQNKVGQFTSNPLIRNIIGQPNSSFDLRKMMDEKKILIVNLSKGRLGEGNANLLGSMLITKIYLAAMSRADASERTMTRLPNFYLYVDEFQSFANESFADILSEARKYKLNLTVAHQYIEQMSEEVRAAIFGNVGTMLVFRVGPFDAEIFEKEFMPTFLAEDFVNLGMYQMYLKLMIDGVGSQPFSAVSQPPIEKQMISFKEQVLEMSRKQFSLKRAEVEEDIVKQMAFSAKPEVKKSDVKNDLPRITHVDAGNRKQEEKPVEKRVSEKPKPTANTGVHLDGLRRTLAGVLGETDLSGPKKTPPTPEVTPIIQRQSDKMPEKAPLVANSPLPQATPVQKKETHFVPPTVWRKENITPLPRPNIISAQNNIKKPDTNSANRDALRAVLSQLKQKETVSGEAKKEINESKITDKPNNSDVPKNSNNFESVPSHNRSEIPEKDLREMLKVTEVKHEEKK